MKQIFDEQEHETTRILCHTHGINYNPSWKRLELIIARAIFWPDYIFAGKLKEAVEAHNRVANYFVKYPEKESKFMEEGNYFDILHAAEKEGINGESS